MDKSTILGKLSPSITAMIRTDHSHVMMTSHKYAADASPSKKHAIIETICLALDIHAQLEEEIFYPALRQVDSGNEVLAQAKPEHDEMRRLSQELRGMEADDAQCDARFMELMRHVIHHVADEETVLLPAAERLMTADRLCELGAQMTKRRLQLAAPHAGEMALNAARTLPTGAMLVAGGLLAGAYLLGRGTEHRHH
ncbi:MAG TPA: hemerythrin domain-containing protein [Albitalea sp.]|nr:hemerythrin domain-containing protein [Albitalea sp.]